MNCIYNASWNGVSLNKSKFYVYGLPVCSECAKGLIQVGVKSILVKVPKQDATPLIWKQHEKLSKELFLEAGIEYARI
jgi:dCMP deaminase